MIIGISGKIGSGKDLTAQIIQYLTFCKDFFRQENQEEWEKTYNMKACSEQAFNDWLDTVQIEDTTFEVKRFADTLKDMVCLLLGCTREQLEDREFKEKELGEEWWYYLRTQDRSSKMYPYVDGLPNFPFALIKLTPRLLLQFLGTECGREILHPNIWVNALFSDYVCIHCGETPCSKSHKDVKGGSRKLPNWIITDMRFPNEMKAIEDRGGITIRIDRDPYKWLGTEDCPEEFSKFLTKEHPSETGLDNATFKYTIDNNGTIEELILKIKEILIKENII